MGLTETQLPFQLYVRAPGAAVRHRPSRVGASPASPRGRAPSVLRAAVVDAVSCRPGEGPRACRVVFPASGVVETLRLHVPRSEVIGTDVCPVRSAPARWEPRQTEGGSGDRASGVVLGLRVAACGTASRFSAAVR